MDTKYLEQPGNKYNKDNNTNPSTLLKKKSLYSFQVHWCQNKNTSLKGFLHEEVETIACLSHPKVQNRE